MLMSIMPHLRSVEKGALLFREGVTSPLGLTILLIFTTKITKNQDLPGASPLGLHQDVALDPLGALRRSRRPPLHLNSWIHP